MGVVPSVWGLSPIKMSPIKNRSAGEFPMTLVAIDNMARAQHFLENPWQRLSIESFLRAVLPLNPRSPRNANRRISSFHAMQRIWSALQAKNGNAKAPGRRYAKKTETQNRIRFCICLLCVLAPLRSNELHERSVEKRTREIQSEITP